MALAMNVRVKFVFMLFCAVQVQGRSKLRSNSYSDGPYNEFFREVTDSVNKIANQMKLKLNEGDIHIEKYVETLKETVGRADALFQESWIMLDDTVKEFRTRIGHVPNQIDRVLDEIKAKDPELAENLRRFKVKFVQLKDDIMKVQYEEVVKPISEHYYALQDELMAKTVPIVERLTPIVKDIEEIILTFISTDKKKDIKEFKRN